MPGLYHFFGEKKENTIKQKLKTNKDIIFKDIIFKDNCEVFVFSNSNYPHFSWNFCGYNILFIGMIYNMSKEVIIKYINSQVELLNAGKDNYLEEISDFIYDADGDYIVYIYNDKNRSGIIYNDILGRLPLYYYSDGSTISMCSELKGVLHNVPVIKIDHYELINTLAFSHSFGNKTIFKNVFRLNYGTVLTFNDKTIKEKYRIKLKQKSLIINNKEDAINYISEKLILSVKNRIDTLKVNGYSFIADLTGGFDSRIIYGSLSQVTKDINYFTFEYIQDESIIARKLFNKLESKGTYNKLSFKNEIIKEKIPEIVYKTDGLVNYYTSYICYNDLDYLYKHVASKKTARFGGLGGEFFRHPYKIRRKNLLFGIKNGFYNADIDKLIRFFNIDKEQYYNYLKEYLNENYNDTLENNIKKFYYYEYYRIHVGLNAEDRERIHFWTVHPLWTKDLISFFINDFPLRWANYNFFTKLMSKVDERLLEVPIFNSNIILKSNINRIKYDIINDLNVKYKTEIKSYLTYDMKYFYYVYKLLKRMLFKEKKSKKISDFKMVLRNKSILHFNDNVDIEELNENIMWRTIIIYINEIVKNYPDKVKHN